MAHKIILVGFAGTLVKGDMIEEANHFRSQVLRRALPTKLDHSDPEPLYKVNRDFVENLTGLTSDVKIRYRENDLDFLNLTGEQVQNQISTNLFQIGMYMVAKKHTLAMFPSGFMEQLQRIRGLGYKLAIVSGVRTDIISGVLAITQFPVRFDYIYGQPPVLGYENQQRDVASLSALGTVKYVLGDKMSDLQRKASNTQSIYVTWGHPAGGEEEFADYTISDPKELERIIK